ncbi:MAG: LD-carboxypeptidase [Myxococcota bacterium]
MRIGIFALSGPISPTRYASGVGLLRSWGHDVIEAPGIDAHDGYLAGSDRHRLNGFSTLLNRADLDLLMAARGGYGVHRILPALNWGALGPSTPPILGFSDLTALHVARWTQTGAFGLHGPVVTQLGALTKEEQLSLKETLHQCASRHRRPPEVKLSGDRVIVPGRARGVLFGGNVALLASLVGTPFSRWPADTLLVLEDTGEAPYRLDRMLTQIELSGLTRQVRGVAVGDFVRGDPPSADAAALQTVEERVARWSVPVLSGVPVGHGWRNRVLPLGVPGELDADTLSLRTT